MMWGFGMLWMLLIPLLVIGALVVLGAALLGGGRLIRLSREEPWRGVSPAHNLMGTKICPSCGRPLPGDWQYCPYDGTEVRSYGK